MMTLTRSMPIVKKYFINQKRGSVSLKQFSAREIRKNVPYHFYALGQLQFLKKYENFCVLNWIIIIIRIFYVHLNASKCPLSRKKLLFLHFSGVYVKKILFRLKIDSASKSSTKIFRKICVLNNTPSYKLTSQIFFWLG